MAKVLYLVTEDWFFASHFLPMARAAREAGLEVMVAARVRNHVDRLKAEGLRVIRLDIERKSLGTIEGLRNFIRTYRIVRAERPDIVHCIALRPIVLGGLRRAWRGQERWCLRRPGLASSGSSKAFPSAWCARSFAWRLPDCADRTRGSCSRTGTIPRNSISTLRVRR